MKTFLLPFFLIALILACTGKEKRPTDHSAAFDGAAIYKKYCILCHGADGKLGVNGSKDVTVSTLSKGERIELIKNGKNAMTPFKGILKDEEIEAVAEYTMSMK